MTLRVAILVSVLLLTWSCSRHTANLPAGKRTVHPSAVATVMKRHAINAVDAGDGDLRVRALRQKMAAEPDNLAVRLELARHYERAGYPELAVEHCRLAAARFPGSVEVQLSLARLLRDQGLTAEAAAGLARYLEPQKATRDLWTAWSWLGILRDDLGALPAAELAHREALKLRPGQDSLHNNLGYNLLLQGRNGEAADEFRRALDIRPASQIARNNLGQALTSQPGQALLHWQSVSDPATAHSNLGAVLIERGQYRDARREIDIALGYRRDHPAALRNLQLVSELDGQPAAIGVRVTDGWWKRFGRAVGKALIGTETKKTGEASKTASR